jgi:hypothetical protein
MMLRLVLPAAWLAAAILGAHSAGAAAPDAFRIGGWSGGPHLNGARQLEQCRASSVNAAGTTLSYSVSRRLLWSVTFSNPAWSFSRGLSLPLKLRMGDRESQSGRAVAVDGRVLEVQADDPIGLFARLQQATALQVIAGGLAFDFQLDQGDEVLAALAQCVLRHTGMLRRRPARETGPSAADDDEEAMALAVEILPNAGIADARMSPSRQVAPELRAAAAWKAGLITGAVAILRLGEEVRIEHVPGRLIEADARACPGAFFFVPELDAIDQLPVARVLVSCRTAESLTTIHYLAVARPRGGFYVLSARSTGGGIGGVLQRQTEQVDAKVRAALSGALSRLERELSAARP